MSGQIASAMGTIDNIRLPRWSCTGGTVLFSTVRRSLYVQHPFPCILFEINNAFSRTKKFITAKIN